MANKHNFLKSLSTGHLSVVLFKSKHGASIRVNRIGAWLNLEKTAKQQSEFIKTKIIDPLDEIKYRPPKDKIFKLSIKAMASPKTLIKRLPKPLIREGMRLIREGN